MLTPKWPAAPRSGREPNNRSARQSSRALAPCPEPPERPASYSYNVHPVRRRLWNEAPSSLPPTSQPRLSALGGTPPFSSRAALPSSAEMLMVQPRSRRSARSRQVPAQLSSSAAAWKLAPSTHSRSP